MVFFNWKKPCIMYSYNYIYMYMYVHVHVAIHCSFSLACLISLLMNFLQWQGKPLHIARGIIDGSRCIKSIGLVILSISDALRTQATFRALSERPRISIVDYTLILTLAEKNKTCTGFVMQIIFILRFRKRENKTRLC